MRRAISLLKMNLCTHFLFTFDVLLIFADLVVEIRINSPSNQRYSTLNKIKKILYLNKFRGKPAISKLD